MSPEMIGGIAAEQYFAPLAITLLSCLTHLIAYCDGGGIIAQRAVRASENKRWIVYYARVVTFSLLLFPSQALSTGSQQPLSGRTTLRDPEYGCPDPSRTYYGRLHASTLPESCRNFDTLT